MSERRTPFYDYHLRAARDLIKGGGDFMFPTSYGSPMEEHLNVRSNVGMQDLSTMGEIDIKGPGAERLVNRLLVNEVMDLEPGRLRYSTMCNESGGIVDDVTVYKFDDEHFMVVTSSGPRKKVARWISEHARGTGAYTTDVTAAVALPVVQGPRSRDFLKTVVEEADLDELRFFRFARATVAGIEVIVSRSGYTGELGYELYTPADEAGVLWEHLLHASKEFGLRPYGVEAMQSLRIEKALPLYGPDISEDRTPFHVGLERWISFRKRDFIGREALLRVREGGLDDRWVGLTLQSEAPAAPGDAVYAVGDVATSREPLYAGPEAGSDADEIARGELRVGRITSSARGYTVGATLALAYVDTSHCWPGNNLLVEINGRPIVARVTPTPFFDPGSIRARSEPVGGGNGGEPPEAPRSGAPRAGISHNGSPAGAAR